MFLGERPLPSLKDPHVHTLKSSLEISKQCKAHNVSKSKSKNLQTKETKTKVKEKRTSQRFKVKQSMSMLEKT